MQYVCICIYMIVFVCVCACYIDTHKPHLSHTHVSHTTHAYLSICIPNSTRLLLFITNMQKGVEKRSRGPHVCVPLEKRPCRRAISRSKSTSRISKDKNQSKPCLKANIQEILFWVYVCCM